MSDQSQILLQTKLHRPRLPHNLIVRSRLKEEFNQVIDHQLTLICAPAGFGKTTLVCTWLEQMKPGTAVGTAVKPAAWLSLDENDSDLHLFLRYFIAALRTIFKEACAETLALLQAQRQPLQAVINAIFINELEELPGEFILVLDDYHTIRGTRVHNLLVELARHWPRPLHLVLISRIEPPLPLASLRAKGMLHEIRTQNLRFTPEETAAYLSQSQLTLHSQKNMHLLEERFEGWPAGLHLAALSLRSAGSQEAVLSVISGENPNVTGYLIDEVLSHQFPAINAFLIKTCILDRFCAPLCEAILGEVDPAWNARACLDWIERAELFIIPLDERREWYRYHHLFQELLQQRLSTEIPPDQVRNLNHMASIWFEEHGLIDDALHHALAAGDLDLAARQMSAGLQPVIDREDRPTLERWLSLLPEELILQNPQLLIIRAWVQQNAWRLDLQIRTLQQVIELINSENISSLPADERQILLGQIQVLQSQWAYFTNQIEEAISLSRQALTLVPPSWKFARGGAMFYLGMALQGNGQALEAERMLLTEYESYSDKADSYAQLLLQSLGWNYLKTGQLDRVRQIAQLMCKSGSYRQNAINYSLGTLFLSVADYQQNNLESAAQYFTEILQNRYTAHITAYRDAVAGMALIHQIRGESAKAWQIVELISQFDLEQSGIEDDRTRSLRARLMLLQGDLEGAGTWVDSISSPPPDMALFWLEEPQVTRARILVIRGAEADLKLALQILDVLYEITERTHNTRYKIEILALRALAMDAQGDTSQADHTLMQALDLAQQGGFIRVFVDLGEPMLKMLRRITRQDHSAEMIRRILAAFPEAEKDLARLDTSKRAPTSGNLTLAEPLTPRELEVLNLLCGSLSIKEIALQLNISSETVKRHTANIYGKLGVNQRRNAVARAEELNILPPS
jgi:LuxR family transcriptional regulator, maltose regulon positive regulatory protein